MFDSHITRVIGLLRVVKKAMTTWLSLFHRIPERDGQTDRNNCYINIIVIFICSDKTINDAQQRANDKT